MQKIRTPETKGTETQQKAIGLSRITKKLNDSILLKNFVFSARRPHPVSLIIERMYVSELEKL